LTVIRPRESADVSIMAVSEYCILWLAGGLA
jgi:hypothetical protein